MQRVSGTLFVEEPDVVCDLLIDVLIASEMHIIEYLRLDPAVDGLHCTIVGRCPGPGHRMNDMIERKEFIEIL